MDTNLLSIEASITEKKTPTKNTMIMPNKFNEWWVSISLWNIIETFHYYSGAKIYPKKGYQTETHTKMIPLNL